MTADAPTYVVLDLETFNETHDVKALGAWAYSKHRNTGVHCAVAAVVSAGTARYYSWIPGGGAWHPDVGDALAAGAVPVAHNIAFELAMTRNNPDTRTWPWRNIDPGRWHDTMHRALAAGLPGSLEGAASVFKGLPQKDMEGNKLMKRLAKRPVLAGDQRQRLLAYCLRDVQVTVALLERLPALSPFEAAVVEEDRRIAMRGVRIDVDFATQLARLVRAETAWLEGRLFELTETLAAETPKGLATWLQTQGAVIPKRHRKATGKVSESVDKKARAEIAKQPALSPAGREALVVKDQLARAASLSKLHRMRTVVDATDQRLRFALRYYQAHTGRWSSEGVQVHNLRRSDASPEELDVWRQAASDGSLVDMRYWGYPLDIMSQLLRGCFVAAEGHEFLGGDWNAIEARVLAWLAGQTDVLQTFERGEDIYMAEARASGSEDRQYGKVQVLALGYGMGTKTLVESAAGYKVVLTPREAHRTLTSWRQRRGAIVQFWKDCEQAFGNALDHPGHTFGVGWLQFRVTGPVLRIILPSGRALHYWHPHHAVASRKMEVFDEDTGGFVTKTKQVAELRFWAAGKRGMESESTYGGKLAENITQAVARDILAHATLTLRAHTLPVVLHVHDSVLVEVPTGARSLDELRRVLVTPPRWAPGLPLDAKCYRSTRFKG